MFNRLKKIVITTFVMGLVLGIVDMRATKQNQDNVATKEYQQKNELIGEFEKNKSYLHEMIKIYENAVKERDEKIKKQKELLKNAHETKEETLERRRQIFKIEEEKKSIEASLEQFKRQLFLDEYDFLIEFPDENKREVLERKQRNQKILLRKMHNDAIDLTNELEKENAQVFANLIDETKNSLALSKPFKFTESYVNESLDELLYQDIETPLGYLKKLLSNIDTKQVGNKLNVVSHMEQLKKMLISKIDIFGLGDARILAEFTDFVYGVKLLSDSRIAIVLSDHTVILWDMKTSKMIHKLTGHTDHIDCMKLLFDDRLATGSWDGTAILWDIKSGKIIHKLIGHTNWISCMKLLPGDRLATGSHDKTVILWDTKTGKMIHKFSGHTSSVYSMKLLPGDRLATGSRDHSVIIWDTKTGKIIYKLTGHEDLVYHMKLLLGDRLLVGSSDPAASTGYRTVILWDTKTGDFIRKFTLHDKAEIDCMKLLPEDRLVIGLTNSTGIILDIKTGEEVFSHKLTGRINFMKLLSGDRLAMGGYCGTIMIWDIKTGEKIHELTEYECDGESGAVLPDGRLIMGLRDEKKVIIWGIASTELEKLDVMQLALIVRLQELEKNNEVNVFLHPEWQEVFKSLPEKIKKYFSSTIK